MFRYHHFSRSTKNISALVQFYLALGCQEQKRVRDDAQGLTRVVLRLPGTDACLQLIERDDGVVSPPGLDWPDHMAFHTSQFDAALETCFTAGATTEREPYRLRPDSGRIAFVKDPDGHSIELVEK